MKSTTLVEVKDPGKDYTIFYIKPKASFQISKLQAKNYLKDARRTLDEMSKDFNPVGINSLLGALVYEHIGKGYNGKENK